VTVISSNWSEPLCANASPANIAVTASAAAPVASARRLASRELNFESLSKNALTIVFTPFVLNSRDFSETPMTSHRFLARKPGRRR
jgi:hypothetical protein